MKKEWEKNRHKQIHRRAYNDLKGKSIEQRSPHVALRAEEGQWEMDCVVGKTGTSTCLRMLTEGVNR